MKRNTQETRFERLDSMNVGVLWTLQFSSVADIGTLEHRMMWEKLPL